MFKRIKWWMGLVVLGCLEIRAEEASNRMEVKKATIDLAAVNDATTLETRVVQDWKPAPQEASLRQKLIEITVCEWWPGQKVRLPVTLIAPVEGNPCEHLIVANMGLALKPALPNGAALRLLKEKGVGVVLVGMGTIDAMEPKGELHLGMKAQLLRSKDARYTPAWIWGMSDMRGLTAAIAETEVYRPKKVLATGGSKRGVAAAVAGLHDPRFTAIMPVVAPPIGNPGGSFVVGTDPAEIVDANTQFLSDLASGKRAGFPETAHRALVDRQARRNNERITVDEAKAAGWNAKEIAAMNDLAWEFCHVAKRREEVKKRSLAVFYNVGTNDSVSPALVELGRSAPDFPIYIVPGGQHGGPKDSGFTLQVPTLDSVEQNLYAFAEHHFFESRPMVKPPKIGYVWDRLQRKLRITATFPDGILPQKNELSWSVNRNLPYTFAFEYDAWNSIPLKSQGKNQYSAEIRLEDEAKTVEFLTTHVDETKDLPIAISSPLCRLADLQE